MSKGVEVQIFNIDIELLVDDIIMSAGKELAREIEYKSPKRTGKYAKGWTSKYDKNKKESTIYNEESPTLTHLLEFGHLTKNKKRLSPNPHIRPAFENQTKKYIAEMKKVDMKINVK